MLKFTEILNLIIWFRFTLYRFFYLDLVDKLNINSYFFSSKYVSSSLGVVITKNFNKKGVFNLARYYNFIESLLSLLVFDFFFPKKPSMSGKKRKYRLKNKYLFNVSLLKNESFFFIFSYFFFIIFPRLKIKQLKVSLDFKNSINFFSFFSQLGSLNLYSMLGNDFDYFDWDLNIFYNISTLSFFDLDFLKFSLVSDYKKILKFNNLYSNSSMFFNLIFNRKITSIFYNYFLNVNSRSRLLTLKSVLVS